MQAAVEGYAGRLLRENLGFELSPHEIGNFQKFCRQANHDLLKNALKELRGAARAAAKARQQGGDDELLAKIYRVYNRKLGEQQRLFPLLALFESSFRSFLAVWLEAHYSTETWWNAVYVHLRRGGRSSDLLAINDVPISAGVARAIENLLRGVDGGNHSGPTVPTISNGHELLRLSKLSDLEALCKEHWTSLKQSLPARFHGGAPVDSHVFASMFKRVRDARNDCFHHKEVADRSTIASNAEALLDLIDVHAASAVDGVACAPVKSISYHIVCDPRHSHGLPEPTEYRFQVKCSGNLSKSVDARSRSEALMKAIEGLSLQERESFDSIIYTPQTPRSDEADACAIEECNSRF